MKQFKAAGKAAPAKVKAAIGKITKYLGSSRAVDASEFADLAKSGDYQGYAQAITTYSTYVSLHQLHLITRSDGTDVVETAIGRLGQSRHDEDRRDQRRDPAQRDGGAQAAGEVLELGRQHEADGRPRHARDEQEPARRAADLGGEQLGVERARTRGPRTRRR